MSLHHHWRCLGKFPSYESAAAVLTTLLPGTYKIEKTSATEYRLYKEESS